MSELINNEQKRKELLKHMILQLHEGVAPDAVRTQLVRLLGEIPYNTVVEVEQELISEGLPETEVLKLCDIHTEALKGAISQAGAKTPPPGHPVHTFKQENKALASVNASLDGLYSELGDKKDDDDAADIFLKIHAHFNSLMDVEKHYVKKENLLFPFLEKKDITGPPTVMWGKHDETRGLLKTAQEAFSSVTEIKADEAKSVVELLLKPASKAVEEMISKEEEILLPMCMDELDDREWYDIYRQSDEIGYCLFDPEDVWSPEGISVETETTQPDDRITFPSGGFSTKELLAILNTIPFDVTFVDKDDTVRYFSQGQERIFARNRAILGRKVQLCHPPSSVNIVQQILDDFKNGRQDKASFWIEMGGKFILIEYYALRSPQGEYLGTLEVSQDLTEKRALQGERRLLKYDREGD
ncbi:hemerythrin [candidate division LCP-89 bacterium B3_LCP]|uniref:Hemerythrin n=1 Tax=candidate division LCP-89 bacterium B3_LCP TaxID=2012998 RepID=A0A532V0R4_UNCL8|nr:MAG: hemerythrin [candidate division LCP-89 bacterium B3_LCP]